MRDVVSIAHISQANVLQIAEALLQREVIRQRLAGMFEIAERIDDGHGRIARHARDRFLRKRPQHDHIDPALKIMRDVA